MKREEKTIIINALAEKLQQYPHFYLADIADLDAEQTARLRRMCFEKQVTLVVVKNTLFQKALEQVDKADEGILGVLKGATSVMFSNTGNVPAKLIKEFRKGGGEKPVFKAAYVEEAAYVGENLLEDLVNIKSREELIGDIIGLLQSPAKNVISALQANAGSKVGGIVKALEERPQQQ